MRYPGQQIEGLYSAIERTNAQLQCLRRSYQYAPNSRKPAISAAIRRAEFQIEDLYRQIEHIRSGW